MISIKIFLKLALTSLFNSFNHYLSWGVFFLTIVIVAKEERRKGKKEELKEEKRNGGNEGEGNETERKK